MLSFSRFHFCCFLFALFACFLLFFFGFFCEGVDSPAGAIVCFTCKSFFARCCFVDGGWLGPSAALPRQSKGLTLQGPKKERLLNQWIPIGPTSANCAARACACVPPRPPGDAGLKHACAYMSFEGYRKQLDPPGKTDESKVFFPKSDSLEALHTRSSHVFALFPACAGNPRL